MSAPELAYAIEKVYVVWTEILGEAPSMAELARRIDRGYDQVRNALRFVSLDEHVRTLVEGGALLYSVETKLASLPTEKQFSIANHIVLHNLNPETTAKLIRKTTTEGTPYPGMFSGEEYREWQKAGFKLAFGGAVNRAAQAEAGYFEHVLLLLERCLNRYRRPRPSETYWCHSSNLPSGSSSSLGRSTLKRQTLF